jgi:hypothetical protein
MGEGWDATLYSYVYDDPTGEIDPFGLDGSAAYPGGHHYIPGPIRRTLNPEAQDLANRLTTGPLANPGDHEYDAAHRAYNKAVLDLWNKYKMDHGINCDAKATQTDILNFYKDIAGSNNPEIKDLLDAINGAGKRRINDAAAKLQESLEQSNGDLDDENEEEMTPKQRAAYQKGLTEEEEILLEDEGGG